ncbi:GTP cyclohydrolase I, partial [Streptomyces sp. 2MCAF27]
MTVTELDLDGDSSASRTTEDPLVGIARQLLEEIGEDPNRDGLRDTPARFARWWREFINYDPGSLGTLFESIGTSQLVVVSD